LTLLVLLLDHIDDLNIRFALQKNLTEEKFLDIVTQLRKIDSAELQEKVESFDELIAEDIQAVMAAGPGRKATLMSGDKLT
jgi:hypothetical protein